MSCIKQIVDVHSHREAICNGIFSMIFEWHNMRCLQNFRHFYISDNTSSISSENFFSETSLVRSVLSFYKFSFSIRYNFIRYCCPC